MNVTLKLVAQLKKDKSEDEKNRSGGGEGRETTARKRQTRMITPTKTKLGHKHFQSWRSQDSIVSNDSPLAGTDQLTDKKKRERKSSQAQTIARQQRK